MNVTALKDFKDTHAVLFQNNGFKERVLDSYKFTKLENFFLDREVKVDTTGVKFPEVKSGITTITFKDGVLASVDSLPEGVSLKKVSENFDLIKDYFSENNALSNLHHSQLSEGVILEVEKNVEVASPIRILNLLTKSVLVAPAHVVIAKANSKITLIEETRGVNSSAIVSETFLNAFNGASIEHIAFDQLDDDGINHNSIFAKASRDANVKSFIFHTSGKLNRSNLEIDLNETGANGESYSLFLTNKNEHSDINTLINHRFADTTSAQIAKGILDEESKGVFTGKIFIHPKSQRVASSQLNKNLLLSKKAQVHSQPQLEIFADDVKCSHGSTTGQLSDDEVFYFEARGIPANKARTLLAQGYGLEVVLKIDNKEARTHISDLVMESLQNKFQLGGKL
jgi:Fe-S cluster assembly protein SufD